jgi:general secretion pathway protein K
MSRSRAGFALIATLWLMVAITALIAAFAPWARDRRILAANTIERAEAEAAARAAFETVKSRLARLLQISGPPSPNVDPWLRADLAFTGTGGALPVRYTAAAGDVNGALNINTATEEELVRFFLALGAPAAQALSLGAEVLDWRDADNVARANGAEENNYVQAGKPFMPANAEFGDVTDLAWLASMTPALYETALAHVTILGDGRVNIHTASAPVLLSLKGMTPEAVNLLATRRTTGQLFVSLLDFWNAMSPAGRAVLGPEIPSLSARVILGVMEVEIRAEGWVEGSPTRARLLALVAQTDGVVYTKFRRWY